MTGGRWVGRQSFHLGTPAAWLQFFAGLLLLLLVVPLMMLSGAITRRLHR